MIIWFISDTHSRHQELTVPRADVVIHCGDEANARKPWLNKTESCSFFDWYSSLDIETKVFVPGNHSTAIAEGLVKPSDYPTVRFLVHEAMTIAGVRLFGSPYTPTFLDWAYMKSHQELDAILTTIPVGIDILVTHGPPKGILDVTHDWGMKELIHVGAKSLAEHVEKRIKPRIHAFGHLHDEAGIRNFGTVTRGTTQFINCSVVNSRGKFCNNGILVAIEAP
jgi:Icc-related predicted phosphoesterase